MIDVKKILLGRSWIMEMAMLQVIQSWHNPVLDRIMVIVFNDFVGAKGEIWVILGLILFLIKLVNVEHVSL